ncbi:MAG: putative Ig domain-containing protein, partial [Chthoniobacterales bacterium]
MKRKSSIALVVFYYSLGTFVYSGGVTYPDGSVSPFAPGFFGVGICGGAISSEVNGVAANGATYLGAVGNCGNPPVFTNQTAATLFKPDGSIVVLPQNNPSATTTATGISADGKIKSGGSDVACYWDANNQYHPLPTNNSNVENAAYAVSRDGSTIGGDLPAVEGSSPHAVADASLWATGGTGYTNLGRPASYDLAQVRALSADGQLSCGNMTRYEDVQLGITGLERAFVQRAGGGIEVLPAVNALDIAGAYGIVNAPQVGIAIVGMSGDQAILWNDLQSISYLNVPSGAGIAVGIDNSARFVTGWTTDKNTGEETAVMWEDTGFRGTIQGILQNIYKVNIGLWKPNTAFCISGDGYTVGGQGINPNGKAEGFIAILPPILHPPILVNPGAQHTNPGELFSLQIKLKNPDPINNPNPTFSAKGLPQGFHIDSNGGIISGIWSKDQAPAGSYTVTVTAQNNDGTGSTTFTLTLPPQNVVDELLQGHSYLPQNKPPGQASFYASVGKGVSANGQTAVGTDGFGSDARAYQWTSAGGISGLPMMDGALRTYSSALASSADGKTIVGQAASAPGADGNDHSVAVVWTTSTAAAANTRHAPTHYAEGPGSSSLTATNIGLFPQGGVSIANAVSADGSIVVGYGDEKINGISYQVYQAFKWTQADGMVGLGWLPGGRLFSQAYGISADGSTIVGTSDSTAGTQAMRYTAAGGMTGLGLPAGANYGRAVAASSNGSVIVGYNTINGNDHAFRWTAAAG